MTTDAERWDAVYRARKMAEYPDNMLIRFVAKHYYGVPDRAHVHFLDVGAGSGASTRYLLREGFRVHAVDISTEAMRPLIERCLSDVMLTVTIADAATWAPPVAEAYDAVIDISSLCYLDPVQLAPTWRKLHAALKPGGRAFSIMPTPSCDERLFTDFAKAADGLQVMMLANPEGELFGPIFGERNVTMGFQEYQMPGSALRSSLHIIEAVKA